MTSLLLTLVMLLSLLPTTALAAGYADVEVNGVTLSDGKYLASNSTKTASSSSTEPTTYVAWYKNGVLTLNGYKGNYIQVNGIPKSDLTVKLKGRNNTITSSYSRGGIFQNGAGGSITVTADSGSNGTLTINATSSNSIAGINNSFVAGHTLGDVTIKGYADVTIITTADSVTGQAYGIYGKSVSILENASVNITSNTPKRTSGSLCLGIYAKEAARIDTAGKIKIDVKTDAGTGNAHSYGINVMGRSLTLTRADEMVVEWRKSTAGSTSGAPYYPITASFSDTDHAINVDTTNCYASYRFGEPRTVTVNNGKLAGPGVVPYATNSGNFLAGDTVSIKPNEKKSKDNTPIPFKEWTAEGVKFDQSATTASNSFTVLGKDVTVTAMHSPFVGAPVFKSTSDARGTIDVKTVAKLDGATEHFEYVKDGETAYERPYWTPSTTSAESPYQYIFDVTTYNSGDIRYLEAGDYRMAVTLNNERYLSDPFTVAYTESTANISLSQTSTMDFGEVKAGYTTAPAAKTVTITNSGTAATGELAIALAGTHATSFELNKTSIADILAGGNATFTVQPKTGLPAGTYTATVKVSGTGLTEQSFDVQFTVKGGTSSLIGDVNGDGTITADDLTALARHVAKISIITDTAALARCDVTKDGSVTADDLTMLARYVAKIISSFA